jgi:hypothetical protein
LNYQDDARSNKHKIAKLGYDKTKIPDTLLGDFLFSAHIERNRLNVFLKVNVSDKCRAKLNTHKAVACIYLYIHTVMNTTILQLVTIYKIQLHVRSCM